MAPHRTAIYVRVSKNIQQSREAQIQECQLWVARNGWAGVTIYSEAASTLKGDKRPEYARCREDIKRGHIDGLVVWKMDRWGRNFTQLIRDLDMFRKLKVPFACVSQAFTTDSAHGRFVAHMLAVMAETDRDIRAENTSMGLRYAISKDETKRGGRPRTVEAATLVKCVTSGSTWRQCQQKYGVSAATVARAMRAHKKAKAESCGVRGRKPAGDLVTQGLGEEFPYEEEM